MLLEGKSAIITGGGTGIGAKTAAVFAREGAKVAICGRRAEKLEATARTIRGAGGAVLCVPCDITEPESIRDLVKLTAAEFGGIDILINNAGRHVQPYVTHETPVEVFDDFVSINLRVPFLLIREVVPHMLRRGGGAIVNIASMFGIVGFKYGMSYATVKGGLVQMTRSAALDYAGLGIRVNCLCPGGTSPAENSLHFTEQDQAMMSESLLRRPQDRPATTEEQAQTLLFLVGPYSGHITGTIIAADGGYTAQ